MSFNTYETSIASGAPLRLYEFAIGPLKWLYTSADETVEYGGKTFESTPGLYDDGIRHTGDTQSEALTVTCPRTLAVVNLYIGVPTSNAVSLTIREMHRGDPDAEAQIVWVGTVMGCRLVGADRASIKVQPLIADLEKTGLRLSWGRACPNALYDSRCKVSSGAYQEEGVVQAMDGAGISSGFLGTHGDGYFSGGFIAWEIGLGVLERRGIDQQVGNSITLLGGSYGLALGQTFFAYPGCKRTVDDCQNKFNNFNNYGGVPDLPGTSPFNGEPLY